MTYTLICRVIGALLSRGVTLTIGPKRAPRHSGVNRQQERDSGSRKDGCGIYVASGMGLMII